MTKPDLRFPVALSILAACLTLGLKLAAYYLTGSVGLLSDAAESVVNLLAASTAFFSVWYASRPADATHTYGHEKIEYLSSGLEGVLILTAAAGIAWYAVQRLLAPQPLQALELGAALALGASGINLGVARLLLSVGRKHGSIVLEADGQHLMTDVWTSLAVVVGVGLVWLTGVTVLDPLLALAVSALIVWTGFHLVRRSFNGLMDHALSVGEQERVRAAIASRMEAGMTYHALRTRQAGMRRFADFHLLVPGAWSVKEAHDVGEGMEKAIQAALPGIEVTVHIEPIEDRAAWQDSVLLGIEKAAKSDRATP